jgi:predicted AAA+ superfamily ATPase
MYKRPHFKALLDRLREPRRFIQVLSGPRQSGKTTLITQVLRELPGPSRYASADAAEASGPVWMEQQWNAARHELASSVSRDFVLVVDEIQKIPSWSETVKKMWDEDTRSSLALKVVLLGSSSLLLQRGLTESLTGRFEILRLSHWMYAEMRDAFGFNLDQYIYFGGYPGAAPLIFEERRWRDYVRDSIIETTISRDILMMSRVDKPALLRQLFELGVLYSGRVLSFNKMLGQLQDAGNTTTLSHYLDLLSAAGLLTGLQKYAATPIRRKASSPKLQVMNTALMSALAGLESNEVRKNPAAWGRMVESAVGAHLLASAVGQEIRLGFWLENRKEVDFVLEKGGRLAAVEVKSGRTRDGIPGIGLFLMRHPRARAHLVGGEGMKLEDFFLASAGDLL